MFRTLISALLVYIFCQAACKKTTNDCTGPAMKDCMCTMEYNPVCGCDGKVYSNACTAKCAGVKKWKPGACE